MANLKAKAKAKTTKLKFAQTKENIKKLQKRKQQKGSKKKEFKYVYNIHQDK